MTTDLRDKTVEDWIDHLGQHHNAGCDGDHGTLSCCNQHNLIEVLNRRLAEAEQKIAKRDELLADYRELLRQSHRLLDGYGNRMTYEAPRIGGVLTGCRRGSTSTPDELMRPARMFCKKLELKIQSLPASANAKEVK